MKHHILQLDADDSLNLISKLPDVYGEPFADPSALPTLLLSQFVSQSVKVCLSGDGADELFAGYGRYYNFKPLNTWYRWINIPSYLQNPLHDFIIAVNHHPFFINHAKLFNWPEFSRLPSIVENLASITSADSLAEYGGFSNAKWGPTSLFSSSKSVVTNPSLGNFNIKDTYSHTLSLMQHDVSFYLPDDILFKTDSSSMFFGLEVRSPFLDSNVVDEAFKLQYGSNPYLKTNKNVLKEILLNYLPDYDLKAKRGFGIPLADWLRGPLRVWCQSLLNSPFIFSLGMDHRWILFIWNQHSLGTKSHAQPLWNLVMLLYWLENNV